MFTNILYRPALAIVISIILVFLGVLGIATLPTAQFPDVAPPTVQVAIAYPGASANVLVDSVLIPLEQSINGVQNMRYMVSDATSAGEATILIFFEPGTDPNINVVNVQNRVNIMLNRLPPLVQREGILVSQVVPSMLMYVNIYSTDPNADQKDLFNFANVNVMPVLKRIQGMGIPRNLGNRSFAMRIWLNPDRMRAYKISTDDVMKAVAEQSVIGSPGRLGQATGRTSQSREYVLTYIGRFNKPEQYANIILKANPEGEILRSRTSPRSNWAPSSSTFTRTSTAIPRHPSFSSKAPGSNAAAVIEEIKKRTRADQEGIVPSRHGLRTRLRRFQLSGRLHRKGAAYPARGVHLGVSGGLHVPRGFTVHADPDPRGPGVAGRDLLCLAVDGSVDQPDHALRDGPRDRGRGGRRDRGGRGGACQDGREAPFALSGDHGGSSRDQRRDHRHHPGDDVRLRSGDVHSRAGRPVLPPVRHHDGHVHRSLRPGGPDADARALCDDSQAPHPRNHHEPREKAARATGHSAVCSLEGCWSWGRSLIWRIICGGRLASCSFFCPLCSVLLTALVEKVTGGYAAILRRIVTRRTLTMAVVVAFAVGIVFVNTRLPTGFIPGEDQGIIYAVIQTPPGSTLEYTNAKSQELEAIAKEIKEVTSVTSLAGYEVLTEGRGSNAGTCIINLKNWSDRKRTARQIIEDLEEKCRRMTNVKLEFFEPPAVPGFGAAGGFSMRLLDKTNTSDYKRLGEVTDKFMAALAKRKELKNLFTFYPADYPQYELIINNDVAMQKGVSIGKALDNLNILIGSTYEQGFILFNQFYKVYVQALPEFRRSPRIWTTCSSRTSKWGNGPLLLVHEDREEAGPERDHPL